MRLRWLASGLAAAVALGACGSSVQGHGGSDPVSHRGGDPTVTTCGAPYKFLVAGRTLVSGTCAGTIPEHPPTVRLVDGERFSLRIIGETNARGTRASRAFPVPKPSGSAVAITAVHGLSAYYRASAPGRSRLTVRSEFCPSDPRVSTCSALDVVATYASAPSETITGRRVAWRPGELRAGERVRAATLDIRVFEDARHGWALAFVGNAQYPAVTADGGAVWRIAGPALHVDAAQGGAGVGQIGVPSPHTGPADDQTAFAWGGVTPDAIVDATLDGGRRWWRTVMPGTVLFVGNEGRELVANVYGTVAGAGAGVWAYATRDGRHWSLLGSVASG